MSEQNQRPIEDMTYKEASTELEQIVRRLESGELELEESLAEYARGVELLKSLKARLSDAEQRVQVLVDATDEDAPTTDTASAPSRVFVDETPTYDDGGDSLF